MTRLSQILAVAAIIASTFAVVGARPARAAGTASSGPVLWTVPGSIDSAPIDAIACPTSTLCVAVDRAGAVLWSTDPAGGPQRWSHATVDGSNELTSIACPSSSECVAVDGAGNVLTSSDPTGGAGAWSTAKIDSSPTQGNSDSAGAVLLRGVSCPSTGLCVAVDAAGNALSSTNPTGGAPAWTVTHADPSRSDGCSGSGLACQPPLVGVSCPAVTLCAAVDFAGNIMTTRNPSAAGAWSSTPTGGGLRSLWGVSCPTLGFCATVDGSAGHVITFDPVSPAGQLTRALPGAVYGVWCQSAGLCLSSAHTRGGLSTLLGSYDPALRSATWSLSPLGAVNSIACPSPSLCVAGDDQGDIAAGASTHAITALLRTALEGTRRLPTIAALDRTGRERFVLSSPIAGRVTLTWTVPGIHLPTLAPTLASVSHVFRSSGTAVLTARLTGAGVRLFRAATRRVMVTATATFATSTGSTSTVRTLTFAHPPKPRKPPRRRRR